jgi:hypothetical protein
VAAVGDCDEVVPNLTGLTGVIYVQLRLSSPFGSNEHFGCHEDLGVLVTCLTFEEDGA